MASNPKKSKKTTKPTKSTTFYEILRYPANSGYLRFPEKASAEGGASSLINGTEHARSVMAAAESYRKVDPRFAKDFLQREPKTKPANFSSVEAAEAAGWEMFMILCTNSSVRTQVYDFAYEL